MDIDGDYEFFENFTNNSSQQNNNFQQICRFCLVLIENEEEIEITDELRNQFEIITNFSLEMSDSLSKISCKGCLKVLRKCFVVREKLLENQQKLYEMMNSVKVENVGFVIKEEQTEDPEETEPRNSQSSETMAQYMEEFIDKIKEENTQEPNIFDFTVRSSCKRKYLKVLCSTCGNYFPRFYLKYHKERVHMNIPAARNFQCDLCEKNYSRKNQLKDHLLSHMSSKNFHCKMCDMQFYTQNRLSMHVKNFHYQKYSTYCEYCAKHFKYQATYNDHVKRYHSLQKDFKCTECDKTFFTGGELKSHIGCVHANEPVSCNDCGKVCRSAKALKSHRRCHFEKVLKFKCSFETCGKKFASNAYLQQHLKVHMGQKDFHCLICGQDYYKNTDLKRHIRSIHMKIKIKCEIVNCKSQFARKETYRNHVLSHHKDIGEQNVAVLLDKIRNMQLPEPEFISETSNNVDQ